jgi:hypothetical protein
MARIPNKKASCLLVGRPLARVMSDHTMKKGCLAATLPGMPTVAVVHEASTVPTLNSFAGFPVLTGNFCEELAICFDEPATPCSIPGTICRLLNFSGEAGGTQ